MNIQIIPPQFDEVPWLHRTLSPARAAVAVRQQRVGPGSVGLVVDEQDQAGLQEADRGEEHTDEAHVVHEHALLADRHVVHGGDVVREHAQHHDDPKAKPLPGRRIHPEGREAQNRQPHLKKHT